MDVVSVVKTVALLPVTALSCILRAGLQLLTWKPRWTPTPSHAVMVTGCDRGLGFSLALHSRSLGMTVFAGVMDLNSAGAYLLDEHGVFVFRLDVTDPESVESAVEYVKQALQEDPRMRLAALVNNAGVLVFGEFGWLTWRQVALQLDVNLAGTLRVSRAFLPLLRRDHGRLMVVTSHCAFMPLPAVSVYTASKAGLQAWADALRIEEAQYDVPVIQVVPGSFTHLSGILATQGEHAKEMMDAMSDEDRQFYGDYPQRFNTYIGEVGAMGQKAVREPAKLPDEKLHKMFEEALFSVRPQHRYVHEPWRYTFYHSLFKLAPECARDWIVLKFTSLPSFKQS